MNVKRIHYSGGLSQERFLENGGGRRKPTLLRVKALMSEQGPEIQTRTFGLVLESNNQEDPIEVTDKHPTTVSSRPNLLVLPGGYILPEEE